MEIKNMKLDKITVTDNSRSKVRQSDMAALMTSIDNDGLLQPIGVRKIKNGKHQLVFGFRRLMAHKKLGLKTIPCHMLDAEEAKTEADVQILNLVENEQRSEISDLDRGRYYDSLIKDHFMTESEIAARVGVSLAKLKQCINLFENVPTEFRKKVSSSKAGNAKVKKGMIPTNTADFIVNAQRRHSISKPNTEKLFNMARQDGVTTAHIKMATKLIATGSSFEKAKRAAEKVRLITVEVPVLVDDYDDLVEQFEGVGSLKKALVQSLYGEADQVVFERPY